MDKEVRLNLDAVRKQEDEYMDKFWDQFLFEFRKYMSPERCRQYHEMCRDLGNEKSRGALCFQRNIVHFLSQAKVDPLLSFLTSEQIEIECGGVYKSTLAVANDRQFILLILFAGNQALETRRTRSCLCSLFPTSVDISETYNEWFS